MEVTKTPKKGKTTTKSREVSKAPIAHGVGRRKAAVARVWMRPGKGLLTVNGKTVETYFDTEPARLEAVLPLVVFGAAAQRYDIAADVQGGGLVAQAGAVKLGIARAIVKSHEEARSLLRSESLLTVDSRVKERKKYGQKAARAKFQFVKR